MSTIKRIESGLVTLLEEGADEYRIGPAWDQRTMQTFFSESGAVVVQVSKLDRLYPYLPDYRLEVIVRGRTSMETDSDKSLNDRLMSQISARLDGLTPPMIAGATGESAVGWIPVGAARQSAADDSHQFEIIYNLYITDLIFKE